MTDPRVAVVIPAYQAERYLGEAIESVLHQPCTVAEIVVVDDGSTDETSALAAGFGEPVRVVRRSNGGIGAARNTGFAQTTAELVAFLDADDVWTRESLSSRLPVFADPGVDLVFGTSATFTERGPDGPVASGPLLAAEMPGAMLVRRDAFARVGPFAEGTAVSEGLDWLLRAQEAGLRTATVDEQIGWRRVHGTNNTLRHRAEIGEFAHTLKAALDRRRAAGGEAA
ncbi:MAG: glycosyltransferase family 2 protein [Solirubrobacteraceae bacterium]